MRFFNELKFVMRKLNRKRADEELEQEIRAHIELETEENVEAGLAPEQARLAAQRAFGNATLTKEDSRAVWGFSSFGTLFADLRYGMRVMLKNRGFTFVAVLTLAIGIGVNTVAFTAVNSVLLKPLPIPQPDELVSVFTSDFSGEQYGGSSYLDYLDFRDRADALSGLIAYWRQSVRMKIGDTEGLASVDIVTGNYFDVLGIHPFAGRTFIPEEDRTPGTHPVAVISQAFWQRNFGRDPNITGKTIQIGVIQFNVIGVAPASFAGFERGIKTDVWIPMMMTPQLIPSETLVDTRGSRILSLVGRLKPGVDIKQARARFSVIASQEAEAYPTNWIDLSGKARVISVLPESKARVPAQSYDKVVAIAGLVTIVMLLVLALVCANLAGLLLARAITRQKEMAVRLALGASRRRLIRQLLIESLLVATLGGAVGVFSAWVAFQLAAGFLPPLAIDLTPDARVLAFVISVTFATAGAFGLAPAFLATKVDLISSLKDDNIRGYRRSRLRSGMIVAQIAVSVLLLSVSGLFLRSLTNAATTNPGFNSDNLLLVGVTLPDYKEPRGIELFQQMLERLRPLPGVTAVSLVNRAGLDFDGMRRNVRFEGYTSQPGEDMEVAFNLAGPRYLETMQTPVQRGRDFNEGDRKGATAVAIVNETLARRYFPNQEVIGKRLSVSGPQGPFVEIVGIACDGKYWSLFEEPRPFFSLAILQEYQGYVNVVLRTDGDPSRLIETVRSQILALDPKLLIENITTMNDHIAAGLLPLRIASIASMVFGALALLLSGLGIYGLVAYLAKQRTREIGVRLALGAQPKDILRLVLNQGLIIVMIGIVLGNGAALAITRLVTSFLPGVSSTDVLTFVAVSALLTIVALVASYLPAQRAAKIDPYATLRSE